MSDCMTHLNLIFIKPLLLDKLSFHPLSCWLGIPQVVLQFLQKLQILLDTFDHAQKIPELISQLYSDNKYTTSKRNEETCIEKLEIQKITVAVPAHVDKSKIVHVCVKIYDAPLSKKMCAYVCSQIVVRVNWDRVGWVGGLGSGVKLGGGVVQSISKPYL